MKKLMLLPALALGIASIAAPAAADEVSRVNVAISDLDLTTEQGREVLERRLRYAARQACEHTMGRRNVSAIAEQRRCIVAANASYHDQMHMALGETSNQRVSLLTK
ncbi:MAG: UrcA family protein [Erythrobacter sp.]